MNTGDGRPNENLEGELQGGEDGGIIPVIAAQQAARCDATTVKQCVDAVEQFALESHFDGGTTVDEVRAAVRATDKARRSLADGKTDPCEVILDMLRDMTPRDEDGF